MWPESYYRENDPAKRWELLQEAAREGWIDRQEQTLREELWSLRYGQKKVKKGPPHDRYIGFWVTMNLNLQDIDSRFRRRSILRETDQLLTELGIDATQLEDSRRELVYLELLHAMRIFYSTCTDGTYNSQLFGLMRLKEDKLIEKIIYDIFNIAYRMPKKLAMSERFVLLQQAAYKGFYERYPNHVDLLDQLIESEQEK